MSVAAAVFAVSGLIANAATASPTSHHAGAVVPEAYTKAGGAIAHYAVNKPLCAQPSNPHTLRCFAMERVNVAKGTAGAYRYLQPADLPWGPSGGYSPEMLADIYGYNAAASTKGQLVGIVDWHNDPDVRAELNHFDSTYNLPTETSTSFKVVNQQGQSSPLPVNDSDSAGEIALDVQAVRGVCHTCRILLVEANAANTSDTAAAVNTAVKLGATEISNSYGAPEGKPSSSQLSAYNHPGVVITASTGDQDWHAWTDALASDTAVSADAPYFPSSDPTVVGVGGTRLYVNNDNDDRFAEYVWNDQGVANGQDFNYGINEGGTGGGCSGVYAAKTWQTHAANYASLGCGGGRSAADISAIGDPESGYSVYLEYGGNGWTTIGGTSLSSPVIAAMYALAGGAHGAAYPASTLYVNSQLHPKSLYDVVNPGPQFDQAGGFIAGGNGFCAGATISDCETASNSQYGGQNPNTLGSGVLDCSFPASGLPTGSALDPECNAIPGFDGPSGLGTPAGLGVFKRTAPSVSLSVPSSLRVHHSATFKVKVSESISGAHPTSYKWSWGDGKSTSVSSTSSSVSQSHTYSKTGSYRVTLSIYDSVHQEVIHGLHVTVKKD